jgi:hypothetical protein
MFLRIARPRVVNWDVDMSLFRQPIRTLFLISETRPEQKYETQYRAVIGRRIRLQRTDLLGNSGIPTVEPHYRFCPQPLPSAPRLRCCDRISQSPSGRRVRCKRCGSGQSAVPPRSPTERAPLADFIVSDSESVVFVLFSVFSTRPSRDRRECICERMHMLKRTQMPLS